MKENSHTQSSTRALFRLSDPALPNWGLSAQPGQIVSLGVGQDPKHINDLRSQIIRQLRLQQSIFDEDLGRFWHFSLLDKSGQAARVQIEGMRFVRLVTLVGENVRNTRKQIAGFEAESLGALAGLDRLLAPIIAQNSIPQCPNCHTRMNHSDKPDGADFLSLSGGGETLVIAGQVRTAHESTLRVGQLIEMTEVERLVIGDRLFTHEEIGLDSKYSLSDKVADFGRKLPNLLVVLDSVTLQSKSAQLPQVKTLISNAEQRWGKPIWLLKIAGPAKTVVIRMVVSQGFTCPTCDTFSQPLSIQALELKDPTLLCKQCQGSGHLLDESCASCFGVGLVYEWSHASFFGVKLHELGRLSLANLKMMLEKSDLSAFGVQGLIATLQDLCRLGFGHHLLGDNYMFFSLGERVRWALFEQIACDFSDSIIMFDLAFDVFEHCELKELINVVHELAGGDNCCLVITARTDISDQCDAVADLDEHSNPALPVHALAAPDHSRRLDLINLHAGLWLTEKLSLPLNGVFCLAGPSGSGKTTLLRDVLGDVFKRGGSKLSLVSSSSPVNQKTFSHFEYLDLLSTQNRLAVGSTDSVASISGIDLLLAKLLSQTKDARLKGFLARDFSLGQSRHKCKECLGRGAMFDGLSSADDDYENILGDRQQCELCRGLRLSDVVLKISWNGLEFGQLLAGSWTELEALSFGDASITKTAQNFVHFGFGSMSVGMSCSELGRVDKIKAWLASSFSTHSLLYSSQPGGIFALDYPFVGLAVAEIENILVIMRELTDLGHTIYCVDNNPALSSFFDQTIRVECLTGDSARQDSLASRLSLISTAI